jgi:hypothetical protein
MTMRAPHGAALSITLRKTDEHAPIASARFDLMNRFFANRAASAEVASVDIKYRLRRFAWNAVRQAHVVRCPDPVAVAGGMSITSDVHTSSG